jgi:hypothetical protein
LKLIFVLKAASHGHIKVVEFLVSVKADVNVKDRHLLVFFVFL